MWTCIWVKTASGSNDAWHLWGFGMPKQKDIPSFVFICFNLCQSYPLVNIQKAIENGDLWWIYPFKMVIFRYVNVYQRALEPGQVYPKSLWIRSQDSMQPVAYYLQRAADGRGKKSKSEMKDTTSTQLQIKKTGQFLNSVEASEGFWGILRLFLCSLETANRPCNSRIHQAMVPGWQQIWCQRFGQFCPGAREEFRGEEWILCCHVGWGNDEPPWRRYRPLYKL